MLRFNDDYFSWETAEHLSDEIYYWADVIRVAYYIHRERGFYSHGAEKQVYIIIEHECGDYLRIPYGSTDGDNFEQNMGLYLPMGKHDRKKLLKDAPEEKLIDLYVRKR